jgi:hypothetical protein
MLKRGNITLLNPATWDDRNDAYFMSEYKRIKDAQTVLALCFTTASETYHHWRVFSHGGDGVCVEFEYEKLLWVFEDEVGIRHGPMKYRAITDMIQQKSIDVEELLFLKRMPYRAEEEYRFIYADMHKSIQYKDLDIDLDAIVKVSLSPWIPKAVAKTMTISTSSLIDNDGWKQLTARVKPPEP